MSNDLISREAAKEEIQEKIQVGMEDGYLRHHSMEAFVEGLEDAIDLLDCVPSVDAAPVVHGKWELTEHFAPYQKCSQCSFELPVVASEQEIEINLFPYCPNCGARMDMKP